MLCLALYSLFALQFWPLWPTGVLFYSVTIRKLYFCILHNSARTHHCNSGVAGSVVSQSAFAEAFGLLNEDGTANKSKTANISGNVVSVLQAGAFFGALGSAPISGM